jgi:hypothetical protein
VYIDRANVEFIEAVKQDFGDNTNRQRTHNTLKSYKELHSRVEQVMKVIPVSFDQEGASILVHVKNLLEHEDHIIAINPKYTQLITVLKGAVSVEYKLDKSESPFNS